MNVQESVEESPAILRMGQMILEGKDAMMVFANVIVLRFVNNSIRKVIGSLDLSLESLLILEVNHKFSDIILFVEILKTRTKVIYHDISISLYCKETECITIDGPKQNSPCIFPFFFNGIKYHKCGHDIDIGGYWCSTKVDSSGKHIGGQGNWGICGSLCPKGKKTYITCFVNTVKIYKSTS